MFARLPPYSGISESTSTTSLPGLDERAREVRADEAEAPVIRTRLPANASARSGRPIIVPGAAGGFESDAHHLDPNDRLGDFPEPGRCVVYAERDAARGPIGRIARGSRPSSAGGRRAAPRRLLGLELPSAVSVRHHQMAALRAHGVEVTMFALERGDTTYASEKFFRGRMQRLHALPGHARAAVQAHRPGSTEASPACRSSPARPYACD